MSGGIEAIAAKLGDSVRVTLDPTERHGFEYQSWFGFTLYAEGIRGAVGRGGTYRIGGSNEAATGFTLYVDQLAAGAQGSSAAAMIYLASGHDAAKAAALRAQGMRTLAQTGEGEDPRALGCTHRLDGDKLSQF